MRFILLAILLVVGFCAVEDPNTFSNWKDVKLEHVHIEWYLDVDNSAAKCTAEYEFVFLLNGQQQIHLDVYQLDIAFVYLPENGQVLSFTVQQIEGQSLIQGDRLVINLTRPYMRGETLKLKIKYSLDHRAKALNFLTKEQTGGKTQPYVFSQCEDTSCRSLIPLQDTPAVKHTYSANILTRPEIKVFMSGNQTSTNSFTLFQEYPEIQQLNSDWLISSFESSIPFQSYLIAIIAGDVVQQRVGKRTFVISEPIYIESYAKELEDLESYLTTLEDYIGPYLWGDYKIVIQPPSFPIGGMENPLLTFASPSIIVGDKSGISVAIHEQAHSWTGNTVTCNNWSNFWINEGFTVFLERKGVVAIYGKEYYLINAYDGNSGMLDDINNFGEDESYTSLFPNTAGKNPDDSFSTIPYEKGFQFLTFLESFIGETDFQQMLRAYIQNFQYQSIDHEQVRGFFADWMSKNKKPEDAMKCIQWMNGNWTNWVQKPGNPPVELDFKTDKIVQAKDLAQKYIDANGAQPENWKDFDSYLTNQKYIFLQYLSDHKDKLNVAIIKRIDDDHKLSGNTNKEILWRWFRSCLQAGYKDNEDTIEVFLGSIGRQKMILPVYTELNKIDHDKAVKIFKEYINFYHPLARSNIAKLLNVQSESQAGFLPVLTLVSQ